MTGPKISHFRGFTVHRFDQCSKLVLGCGAFNSNVERTLMIGHTIKTKVIHCWVMVKTPVLQAEMRF